MFFSFIVISLSGVLVSSSSSVSVSVRDSSSIRATSPIIINIIDSSSSVRLYIYILNPTGYYPSSGVCVRSVRVIE